MGDLKTIEISDSNIKSGQQDLFKLNTKSGLSHHPKDKFETISYLESNIGEGMIEQPSSSIQALRKLKTQNPTAMSPTCAA